MFVALYVLGIIGNYDWKPSTAAIQLLQPIVYVIIGYYFGRMPGEQNEKKLQTQVDRKDAEATKANKDAATQQGKVESAKRVLQGTAPAGAPTATREYSRVLNESGDIVVPPEKLRHAVAAALQILD